MHTKKASGSKDQRTSIWSQGVGSCRRMIPLLLCTTRYLQSSSAVQEIIRALPDKQTFRPQTSGANTCQLVFKNLKRKKVKKVIEKGQSLKLVKPFYAVYVIAVVYIQVSC